MFVGGLRALLLHSLHPLAMAAVAGHSDYRGDPWGRLQRTSYFLAVTTYGRAQDAQQAVDRVRRIHLRVTGTAPDGRPYAASDPHLLSWVHVAEVDSFLRAHSRFGAQPLDQEGRDRLRQRHGQDRTRARRGRPAAEPGRTQRPHPGLPPRTAQHARGPGGSQVPAANAAAANHRQPGYGVLAAAVSSAPGRIPLRVPYLPVTGPALVRPYGARSAPCCTSAPGPRLPTVPGLQPGHCPRALAREPVVRRPRRGDRPDVRLRPLGRCCDVRHEPGNAGILGEVQHLTWAGPHRRAARFRRPAPQRQYQAWQIEIQLSFLKASGINSVIL
jgi:hypothetical protein